MCSFCGVPLISSVISNNNNNIFPAAWATSSWMLQYFVLHRFGSGYYSCTTDSELFRSLQVINGAENLKVFKKTIFVILSLGLTTSTHWHWQRVWSVLEGQLECVCCLLGCNLTYFLIFPYSGYWGKVGSLNFKYHKRMTRNDFKIGAIARVTYDPDSDTIICDDGL